MFRRNMEAIAPVMPKPTEEPMLNIVLGENQPEYIPLPAAYLESTSERPMITRWKFSDEERKAIAEGANLVLQQLTFGRLFQPVNLQVVMPEENPLIVGSI